MQAHFNGGLLPGSARKDLKHCLNLQLKILVVLYIPGACRHISIPGLLPGWTTKDIHHCLHLWLKILFVMYIPGVLRNISMPGLLPGWTKKDIQHCLHLTQNIICAGYPRSTEAHFNARNPTWLNQKEYTKFLKSTTQKYSLCCIFQEHSGTFQCQDSYLAEPQRIYNIAQMYNSKYCLCCITQEHSGTFQ